MSYTLLLRRRGKRPTWSAFRSFMRARRNVVLPPGHDDIVGYHNPLTGVYFRFDRTREGIELELNVLRPFTFALEAARELAAITEELDLRVEDPQEDGIEGDRFDAEQLQRGYATLNHYAYASYLEDARSADNEVEPLLSVPRATIERFYRWNLRYDELCETLGQYYFIANMAFTISGVDKVRTIARMVSDRGVVLPPVDLVFVTRGEDAEDGRCIAWPALANALDALQTEPDGEPDPYWAIVASQVEGALDVFFGPGTRHAPQELILPSKVHAAEDIERAQGASLDWVTHDNPR